jgi:hypothetical protein
MKLGEKLEIDPLFSADPSDERFSLPDRYTGMEGEHAQTVPAARLYKVRFAWLILPMLLLAGCPPTPPGVRAQALVDGPVGTQSLRRALDAETSVTNVAPAGGIPSSYPSDDFTFSTLPMAAAWGKLDREPGNGRSTRITARINWPHDVLPSYRQQADMEDLVRRLVGRVLLAPTDSAAAPLGAAPSGPRYWSGDQ